MNATRSLPKLSPEQEQVRDTLAQYGESFDDSNVWYVQGHPVIYHDCLERMARRANIHLEPPKVVVAQRDHAVIIVTGVMENNPVNPGPKVTEWSVGEAAVSLQEGDLGNYRIKGKQAAYPFAMAEKRAKDRVILKLLELPAYSEEEADEFKNPDRPEAPARRGALAAAVEQVKTVIEPPPEPEPPDVAKDPEVKKALKDRLQGQMVTLPFEVSERIMQGMLLKLDKQRSWDELAKWAPANARVKDTLQDVHKETVEHRFAALKREALKRERRS